MTPDQPETLALLHRVVGILEDLGVAYHVGGSYASSIHGTPRQTQDIDLVVDLKSSAVDGLIRAVANEFYSDAGAAREAIRNQASFNLIHLASGIKVDLFVLGTSAFDRAEFGRRQETSLAGLERAIFVKSPEDTMLRKLSWYREGGEVSERQWADVVGIVRAQGEPLDGSYIERWGRELRLTDLLDRLPR
jgi:hypothetical protein